MPVTFVQTITSDLNMVFIPETVTCKSLPLGIPVQELFHCANDLSEYGIRIIVFIDIIN